TCARLEMPAFPVEKFVEAVKMVVAANADYVPPYGSGASLYLRPFMIGTNPVIGVKPASEFEFRIFVTPVGPYFKGGVKPINLKVSDYDRAAPHGTGMIKAAGNYAASLLPGKIAKDNHSPVALFFDPVSHEYVDEFSTSNFFAITRDGKYITPHSPSILPSITNRSLMQIAEDLGMTVERRPIHRSELPGLKEVAACGTAVVITPVHRIYDGDQIYTYGEEIGPTLKKLYDTMTGIQYGVLPDTHNWMVDVL
ncbi:MAG: branched-chain amino acid aminotransferase, partial [Lentisphaeria bacterium]|nr:branched-chain amino acid aminotransferase [Lentisphaeria bacterium]